MLVDHMNELKKALKENTKKSVEDSKVGGSAACDSSSIVFKLYADLTSAEKEQANRVIISICIYLIF
jgi:hypothetical protein